MVAMRLEGIQGGSNRLEVSLPFRGEQHAQAAKRLGIAQPRVSGIVRGKVELLFLDYLVGLCAKSGIPVGLKVAA